MEPTNAGPQQNGGHPDPGPLQVTGQPVSNQAAPPAATANPNPDSAPDPAARLAELEQQLNATREEANKYKQGQAHWQSQYDRTLSSLQASLGQAPGQAPQDPWVKVGERFKAANFDPEAGTAMAKIIFEEFVAPMAQQQQQAQAALQSTAQVNDVMRTAYSQAPSIFGDQQTYHAIEQQVRQAALNGDPNALDPRYAINLALIHSHWNKQSQPLGQPQQQQAPPLSWGSQIGPASPYSPAPPVGQKPLTPAQQEMQQGMQDYMKKY